MNKEEVYDNKDLMDAAQKLSDATRGEKDFRMAVNVLEDLARGITAFKAHNSSKKATIFGSARMSANTPAYEMVKEVASLLSADNYLVITGGGPGIMEAGLKGAKIGNRLGVTIDLPFEVPDLNKEKSDGWPLARQSLFFTRKLAMVRNVQAFIAAPGGFGTFDELFEVLTLMQTGKSKPTPLVLMETPEFPIWSKLDSVIKEILVGNGLIDVKDTSLYFITQSPNEAFEYIQNFWKNYDGLHLEGDTLTIGYKDSVTSKTLDDIFATRGVNSYPRVDELSQTISFEYQKHYWCDIFEIIHNLNDTNINNESR